MTKTAKVLIGVGIGCGTLVVVAVALIVGAGLWAKKTFGDINETTEQWKVQDAELERLEREHPFPPSATARVTLKEERLRDYLAVRDAALPLHRDMVEKAKALSVKPGNQESPDIAATLGAGVALFEHLTSLRKAFVEGLQSRRMSAREFTAVTMVVYSKTTTALVAQRRAELQEQIDQLSSTVSSATGFQKTILEEQIKLLEKTLQTLPSGEPLLQADAELLARNQDAITRNASSAFDLWVVEGLQVNMNGFGLGRPGNAEPAR